MDIQLSVLFAFGALIFWAAGDFLIQKSVRKIGVVESLFVISLVGSVMSFPFVWNDFQKLFLPENIFLALLLGVVGYFAATLNFRALHDGKLAVVETVFELELPVAVLFGIIFFQETLTPVLLFFITLTFIGLILISLKTLSVKHLRKNLERGVMIGAAGAVGLGLADFFTAAVSKNISPLMPIFVWAFLNLLITGALLVQSGKWNSFAKNFSKNPTLSITTGFIDNLAWSLFAIAVFAAPLSTTIAITESYPAVGLIFGVLINKEKIHSHQFLGAAFAILSSIALGFFFH